MEKLNQIIIYFEVGTKKYPLTITDTADNEVVFITCEGAELNQRYARADLSYLLQDLPEMIKDTQLEKKDTNIPVRFSAKEKFLLQQRAKQSGFPNLSAFIRAKTLQPT